MAGSRQGWREPAEKRRGGWLHGQGRRNGLEQGAVVWPGPVGVDGFRNPDLLVWFGSTSSGRFAIGRGWCLRDRAGLGRKAQLLDGVAQGLFFGVQLLQIQDYFVYLSPHRKARLTQREMQW
jgi:hypothetical protein